MIVTTFSGAAAAAAGRGSLCNSAFSSGFAGLYFCLLSPAKSLPRAVGSAALAPSVWWRSAADAADGDAGDDGDVGAYGDGGNGGGYGKGGYGDGGEGGENSDDGDDAEAGPDGEDGYDSDDGEALPPPKQLGPQPLPPLGRGGTCFLLAPMT